MANLVEDYLAQRGPAIDFFVRDLNVAAAATDPVLAWGEGVREAVLAYQEALGLKRTIPESAVAIVTGQQPGIFTGPLYTIYKAITAIRLAAQVEEQTGRPCVPIFWVGSDDHDFEEVRKVGLLSRNHQQVPLRFEPASYLDGAPMFRVAAESQLHELVDLAAGEAAGSEHAEPIRTMLKSTLDEASSIAHWFALLLARLFEDSPLCIFVPHLTAGRLGAVPVLRKEIAEPLATTRLANAGGEALRQAGYTVQVEKGAKECSFFLEMGGRRRKVLYEDEQFRIPEEGIHCSVEEMLAHLESGPERFTPNVVLRPVVQQALFPVAAYVAGPGELAYWAQLRQVFEHLELPMPVVYPRSQAVITSIKTNKLMRKFGFAVGDLFQAPDTLEQHALRAIAKNPALDLLNEHGVAIRSEVAALGKAFANLPGRQGDLTGMHETFATHLEKGLARMERSLLQADQAQVDAVRKQVARVCATLAPDRKPQERVYTVFSWLFAYGPDLIPRLTRELNPQSFSLQEIEL